MAREKARIAVSGRLVDEDPAMLSVRLFDEPVVLEGRNRGTRKDPLVHRTLDGSAFSATPLGDDDGAAGEVDAIDLVLPLPHPQRRNLQRPRSRIQLTPRSRGGVIHHV